MKSYNNYNNSNSRNYFLNNNQKNKITEKIFVLKDNMFPQLNIKEDGKECIIDNKELTNNEKNDFKNLFQKESEVESEDLELEKKDGWITIKKGIPYSPKIEKIEKEKEKEEPIVEPYKVFEKLNKVYENWKKNYIEQWGYDEYEKNYRFPHHDYSYLESEEEEMEAMDF